MTTTTKRQQQLQLQRETRIIRGGITITLCHIRIGGPCGPCYWFIRYTDECGVRQKVYLGKRILPDGHIEDRVRCKSPGLFPSGYAPAHGQMQQQQQGSRSSSSSREQEESMIFRCCSCGEHPTDNPLFVICDQCRTRITNRPLPFFPHHHPASPPL